MATFLRKSPYQVDMLLGGVDEEGPALYLIDYLASSSKVDYGAHGYGSFFITATMDRYFKVNTFPLFSSGFGFMIEQEDMNEEEALELAQKCINEIAVRFLIKQPKFKVKIIKATGHEEKSLTPSSWAAAGEANPRESKK